MPSVRLVRPSTVDARHALAPHVQTSVFGVRHWFEGAALEFEEGRLARPWSAHHIEAASVDEVAVQCIQPDNP